VAQKFHFAILRIEVTRATRGLRAIVELLVGTTDWVQSQLWSPYGIGQTIIFLPCCFFLSIFFFPRLISAAADWISTILRHMVLP